MTTFIASIFRSAALRRSSIRMLELDDHLLNDIGLTRHELQQGLRRRPSR